jgi:hypothetical protein
MTCATAPGSPAASPAVPSSLRLPSADRAQDTVVGTDWEVLLLPCPLARQVVSLTDRSRSAAAAIGWVFADGPSWGLFVPPGSQTPRWPAGTTYLATGATVTLPGRHPSGTGPHWVRLTGSHPLSQPLLLHPLVTWHASLTSPPHDHPRGS